LAAENRIGTAKPSGGANGPWDVVNGGQIAFAVALHE
jgi:hypothetical protein